MNTKELQHHIAYMKIAETIGKLSYCVRKKVGSVLVKDNNIISTGYNGTPSGTQNQCEDINGETHWYTLHSEANCISKIAKSTLSSEGSILYLTLSPCKDCSKLILQAGIKEIYYLVEHSCKVGLEFLESNGIKCFNLKRNIKQLEEESGDKTKDYVINIYEEYSTIRFGKDVGFISEWELLHSVEVDNKSEIEITDESESLVVNEIKEPEQVYLPSILPLSLILELMKHFQDKYKFILDDGNIKHDKSLDLFMKQSNKYYFKMIEKVGINMWILDWFKSNNVDNFELIDNRQTNPNKIYLKYNPVLNFKKEIIQQNRNNILIPNNFPDSLIMQLNSQFNYNFIKTNIYPNWHKDTLFLYGVDNKYIFKNIKEFQPINKSIKQFFNLQNNRVGNWFLVEEDENNSYLEICIVFKTQPIIQPLINSKLSYLIPVPINLGQWKVNPEYVFPTISNLSSKEFNYQNGQLQYKPISIVYSSNNLIVHNSNYEKLIEKEIVCIPNYVFPQLINDNLIHVFGNEIKITEWESNNFIERNILQGNYIEYTFKLDTDLKKQIFNYIVELVHQESILNIQKIDDKTLKIMK